MTYEAEDEDGTHWRIHIDDSDPEHAYLYSRAAGDHTKWDRRPLELTVVP